MQNFHEWFKNKAYYTKLAEKKETAINDIVKNAVFSGISDLASIKTLLKKRGFNLTLVQMSKLPLMINSALGEEAFRNKEKGIKPKEDSEYYSDLMGRPVSIKAPNKVGLGLDKDAPPAFTRMKRVRAGLPTSHLLKTKVQDIIKTDKLPVGHNVIGLSRTDDDIMSLIDMES